MAQAADSIQQLVHKALQRFEELAASDESPSKVLDQMLATLVGVTSAQGAVIWMPSGRDASQPDNRFAAVARQGESSAMAIGDDRGPLPAAAKVIGEAAASRKPVVAAPDAPEFRGTPLQDTTQLFVSVDAVTQVFGVIQLLHRADLDPKTYRQYAAFTQQAARAAGMYLSRRQTEVISQDAASASAVLSVAEGLLSIDKPRDISHELANRARNVLNAQRVAVVNLWTSKPETLFSDAVDVNRRAVLVRAVEMLAEIVKQRQTPMSFVRSQEVQEEDKALEPLLEDIWTLGSAQAICLTPLRREKQIIAVMAVEYGETADASRKAPVQQQLCRQAGPILYRAVSLYRRPLRRTSNLLARLRAHPSLTLARTLLVGAILTGIVYGLFFLPIDMVVRGDGRLEPARLAQVTAPVDGQILKVNIRTGDTVAAGDVLVEIDDEPIQLQLAETEKLIHAQKVELAASGERSSLGDPAAASDQHAAMLQIEALEIRRRSLLRQIEKAVVRASIAGVVLTEETDNLIGMTVAKGDLVLRIADLEAFDLVVELKEEDLALVDTALREGQVVPATFRSRAWPDQPQTTDIDDPRSLSPTSSPDEYQQQHVFRVQAPIDLEGISGRLALANPTGRARLVTGTTNAAWRYGRGVWRFLQMTILF